MPTQLISITSWVTRYPFLIAFQNLLNSDARIIKFVKYLCRSSVPYVDSSCKYTRYFMAKLLGMESSACSSNNSSISWCWRDCRNWSYNNRSIYSSDNSSIRRHKANLSVILLCFIFSHPRTLWLQCICELKIMKKACSICNAIWSGPLILITRFNAFLAIFAFV